MSKRASIFDDLAELDIGTFAPKKTIDENAPPPEKVRAVAEASQFRSRESKAPPATLQPVVEPQKRPTRTYRTGRNTPFHIKARKSVVDEFYAISDAKGWVLGETLEHAVEALKREFEKTA